MKQRNIYPIKQIDDAHFTEGSRISNLMKRRVGSSHWRTLLLLLSIPVGALYIGYAVGNYLLPKPHKFPDKGVVVDIGQLNYSWYNTHNITLEEYIGGVGNQMFQYASLYGIARANGLNPVITTDTRLLDIFPFMKAKIMRNQLTSEFHSFTEFNPSVFDGRTFSLNFMKNVKLHGFFQSWRYSNHVRADIRKQFVFSSSIQDKVVAALKDIRTKYIENLDDSVVVDDRHPVQFVGVHIRRGDMLEPGNIDKGYTIADAAYIHRAIDYFDVTYRNVIYIVCSDDEHWSRENTQTLSRSSLVVMSPFHTRHPEYDLCLLSLCNHTIITVGTFGWWGAWLAGGDVVYYKNYPAQSSTIGRHFSTTDYYPSQWIPL